MLHHSGRAVLRAARDAGREVDAPLVLAVSGGLDSMALLHAMAAVARSRIAAVATFDHGTGGAATAAGAHVARSAASLGLPVVVARHPGLETGAGGREAAWRTERYRFLREVAVPLGARIVTAHTEDDQVETVLMRVLRGSGARGLAGLYAPSVIVRPFLGVRRDALGQFVRASGVRWREDPSNRSRAFLRNRVRQELLPALRRADPSIDSALLEVARRAARWRAEVESFVDESLRHVRAGPTTLEIAREALSGFDRDSLAVLWTALAGRVGLALDRRGTHRLTSFTMSEQHRGVVPLSGGWRLERSPEAFVLRREPVRATGVTDLPEQGSIRWGAFRFRVGHAWESGAGAGSEPRGTWHATIALAERASVRSWSAGDRLAPAGGQRRRRVKRYLTEAGVRGLDRAGWPVVVAGDDVVWIPGVRRSDAATERSGRPVRHYVCDRIDR